MRAAWGAGMFACLPMTISRLLRFSWARRCQGKKWLLLAALAAGLGAHFSVAAAEDAENGALVEVPLAQLSDRALTPLGQAALGIRAARLEARGDGEFHLSLLPQLRRRAGVGGGGVLLPGDREGAGEGHDAVGAEVPHFRLRDGGGLGGVSANAGRSIRGRAASIARGRFSSSAIRR